jgi:two-component system chemotaxis response regulator CheY
MARRVLSVGQCAADHGSISHTLQAQFGASVESAQHADDALERLRDESFDLVLVNRIFDRDGDSGLDFIRRLKGDEALRRIPVMLVSNYHDAQTQAQAVGAVPGFGKAALGKPLLRERLEPYLGEGKEG